jgi:RNA polymerase sigma-70 factor (ECF subfamily)
MHAMERDELATLYQRYGAAVERRCRALLGDGEEARDMVQEVFLRATRSAREFRGESSPMTWLYRISTNLCLNRLRDRRATIPLELVAPLLPSPGVSPERAAGARDEARTLLADLDERTRAVVVYRYLDGMTQDEIAAVTGWSRRTLGKKLGAFEARAQALRTGAVP